MKLFVVCLTVASCLWGAQGLACSTSGTRGSPPKKCPNGMKCQIVSKGNSAVDIPNSGNCVAGNFVDFNKANAAFNAVDKDHSGTITFGGAYKALTQLFPDASERTLDYMTKRADKTRIDAKTNEFVYPDGKIDQSEFITLYSDLLRQQHISSNPCDNTSACGDGQICFLCRAEGEHCCKDIVTVGPTEKPNGGLSRDEFAQVMNLFEALNTKKTSADHKAANGPGHESLSYAELFAMLRKAAATFGTDSTLYRQVSKFIMPRDQDKQVDFKEFVTACGKLKSSDPKDFQKFLTMATSQNTLPVGSSCVPTLNKKCAKGASCLPVQKIVKPTTPKPTPPQIYDGGWDQHQHPDGHLMVPPRRRRTVAALPTYSAMKYTSYRCQVRPATCAACVSTKGKWFGSHCIVSGESMVYDAPMTTTVTGCKKKTAMNKAKCSQYKSCELCTTKGKDQTLGQLCAWSSNGSGGCAQNQATFWGPPMITAPTMCKSDIVQVHD